MEDSEHVTPKTNEYVAGELAVGDGMIYLLEILLIYHSVFFVRLKAWIAQVFSANHL